MGMRRKGDLPTKGCAGCGRPFAWRKKWERDWDRVTHCSDACRRAAKSPDARRTAEALERAILDLLSKRPRDGSICPSEAALIVGAERWRDLMEESRSAARRLVAKGAVEITQRGRPVDPSRARGPIRVRLARRPAGD